MHGADLLAQLLIGADPVALQVGDAALIAQQRVVQRGDGVGHRVLGLGTGLIGE